MTLTTSTQLSFTPRHHVGNVSPFRTSLQPVRKGCTRHVCACSASDSTVGLDRRQTLLSLAAAVTALNVSETQAEGGERAVGSRT